MIWKCLWNRFIFTNKWKYTFDELDVVPSPAVLCLSFEIFNPNIHSNECVVFLSLFCKYLLLF